MLGVASVAVRVIVPAGAIVLVRVAVAGVSVAGGRRRLAREPFREVGAGLGGLE